LHLRWFRAAAMAARMSLARLVLDVACGDAWRRLACVIQLARDMAGGCAIRETQPTSNLLVEASRLGFSRNISGLSILAINSASELRPQCYIRACLLTGFSPWAWPGELRYPGVWFPAWGCNTTVLAGWLTLQFVRFFPDSMPLSSQLH
jgi:hypothetical protein